MDTNEVACKVSYIVEEFCNHVDHGWSLLEECALRVGHGWDAYGVRTLPLSTAMDVVRYLGVEDISAWELMLAYAVRNSPVGIMTTDKALEVLKTHYPREQFPIGLLAKWPIPACYVSVRDEGVIAEGIQGIVIVPDYTDAKLLIGIEAKGVDGLVPMIVHLDDLAVFEFEPSMAGVLACTDSPVPDAVAIDIITIVTRLADAITQNVDGTVMVEPTVADKVNDVIWGRLLETAPPQVR